MDKKGGDGWRFWGERERDKDAPTALLSMISWAFTLAAEDMAGVTLEAKNRRRNEIVGGDGSLLRGRLVIGGSGKGR